MDTLLRAAEDASRAFETHRLRRRIEQHQRLFRDHPSWAFRKMYATCLFIAIEALMIDLETED